MNLHFFSSRGSGVYRSLFLRTFMVMMFFITGSNGLYAGEDLKATLPSYTTSFGGNGECEWDGKNKFSWEAGYNNLMPIFEITKGTLMTDYVALKFTTSDYVKDQPYRVCFMNGSVPVATRTFYSAGEKTIKISELIREVGQDLKNVDNIKFGGGQNITSGSITLAPNSIVLVGQLQNNTQRYDFTDFKLSDHVHGASVQSAVYQTINDETKEKALVVTTKDNSNNYFYLYSGLKGTNSTGVRLTAYGEKFRILAKTSDGKTFQVNVPKSEADLKTHYKWEDFVKQFSDEKMTKDDVAKIMDIGLAGDNAKGETGKVFCVKEFWLDDIADYDKTIPCYGDEGGHWDGGKNSFVYITAGATAVFENNTRDANHNIILNKGNNLKLSLSSDVSKFTEVCLVFAPQTPETKTDYDLTVAGKTYTGKSTAVIFPVNSSELTIQNNSEAIYLSKIIYSSEKVGINEERTITVDGETRNYWLYVPASLEGRTDVPVVFSLHGRYNTDKPDDPGKPVFTSLAKEKGFIVVYPQGRNGGKEPNDWNNGFVGTTGWEATGKENADTKFIKALVDKIQSDYKTQSDQNSHISVDPKRFYLCGFSMGGMMTYACAKVLNGTFAAYGSCGGFPLNEFHMNLATENPIPFIHMHGNKDKMLGIKHLHTIIENLLFRNGCKLSPKQNNDDGWTTITKNGMTRYDFTGVNGVPVTTITFDGLDHSVHPSAPAYLWDFFSKTSDTYKPTTTTTTTMKWQWDMTTINSNLSASNGYPYGWKRVAISGKNHGTLTYGDNRKTTCSKDCTSAADGCDGNHNVYNSIQLEKGTYKLHAKANVVSSDGTGIIVGIYKIGATDDKGTCIVRRQVKNNSGDASADLSILCPFTVIEDGEYYIKIERGNSGTTCTALAIHTSDYNPDDVDDSENYMALNEGWETDGLIVKIDFEESNVGANCENIDEEEKVNDYYLFNGKTPTVDRSYKLYNRHEADNKQNWEIKDVILHDAVFGNYFQNIPKAQFYDRSAGQNYMRAVLKEGALKPIKDKGEATIGFWVNGRVAVDAGLSYNDASMLYLTGPWRHPATVDGEPANHREHQSMFNIRCNGNTNGFLNKVDGNQIRYYAHNMFGDLCDNETTEKYYKKNLYLDRNWHYVTMVMYNGLRNVDMYVDGELTNSRKNIVGGDQDLTAGLDSINHIIIGGLNATYTNFGYDPAFAFDDIVIYSRALSSQEINAIISDKKYSPNSWDFEKDIANTALLNEEKLKAGGLWTYNESEKVYTLNKQLSTEAELTYDGNRVIPAFRGLKFKTGTTGQIQIDMKNKRLKVTSSETLTEMTISNAPAGQYLRYEYDKTDGNWLADWSNQNFQGDIWISDSKIGITKVSGSGRQTCTCKVHGTISFKSIGSTDKVYADLCFGTISTDDEKKQKFTPQETVEVNSDDFSFSQPTLHLFFNGLGADKTFNTTSDGKTLANSNVKFWSSAPHVAYITSYANNQPIVKATGVPGSAYIYAELENNNEYDCNNESAGLYESSSRIIARYEIHVPNKVQDYSVKISAYNKQEGTPFSVGEVLSTKEDYNNAVTLTLGGWKYNSGEYFKKIDGYTEKKEWKGMPLKKITNSADGYSSEYDEDGPTTDGDTYSALSSYTGGTHAASSEQMDGDEDKGLFLTTVINNSTAWTLPCRGSYAKIEPTEAGIISVYVLQEGCMERNLTGSQQTYFGQQIAPNEPYDISIKKVYVADEAGQVIEDVVTDTKSKIVSQVWKDDGRARAEYSFYVKNTAYSELLHDRFDKNILKPGLDAVKLLDQWNSPGMTQNIIKFGKGFGIVDKGIVRYTFNVLPGKTYYIFSNDAKMGIAGFNFTKNKQLNFNSKHEIIANNPLAGDLTPTESVTLDETKDYSAHTEKNANVTLNRTFYKNRWNAICLPYSINRRQIEDVFGDGTMVVLMKNIETSTKKVMFIEHANQDIIAGYPYLIFPTDKADNDKTNHAPIPGITTRATFGEANSPIFTVGTDGITYSGADMQSDALVFKGTFTNNTPLTEGSYVVTNKGVLSRIPNDEMKIKPYRSYIYFNRVNTGAKAISLQDMNVNGFENDEDHTTGIENLLFESGILTHSADVYSIDGQLVRSKALNFNGLPKGVYIVNGKKYVKK